MVAKLVSKSLSAATKESEVGLFRKGYHKGLADAAIMCTPHLYFLTDIASVKSQPGIPEIVK
jgi:hypothetical protein